MNGLSFVEKMSLCASVKANFEGFELFESKKEEQIAHEKRS